MSAFNNKNVILTDGSGFDIATYQYGTPNFATSIARGTNHTPTVLDVSTNSAVNGLPIVPRSYVDGLVNSVSEEDYNSDSYQNNKTYFNNNVYWLWGSIDAGGVYIRKTEAGKACVGGVTCLTLNEQSNEYRYIMNESASYTISDMSDLVFMYSEDSPNYDYPLMYVFTLADMRTYGYNEGLEITYYIKKQKIAGVYVPSNMHYMYEITNDIQWIDNEPEMCMLARDAVPTFPHNLEYVVTGLQASFNDTIVSGDPWGGQLADDEDNPTSEGGNSQTGGGGGSYPSSTGGVDHPNSEGMAIDVTNSGFVTLYNPTQTQAHAFANWLFSDIGDPEALRIKRLIANPLDFTLFLALAHFTPNSKVDDEIMYAGISTGIIAHKCSQFKVLEMGYIDLIGDTKLFLDYQPYTKISVFLPYIGIRQLNPDHLIGSRISLVYNIDCLSGACVATLKCTRAIRREKGDSELKDVLYHFDGNCFEQIPLTATDWRGMIQSMFSVVGGVASIAGGGVSGNVGAVGTGITQIVDGVISQKVSVSHAGNLSGASGYIDSQTPYLIIERPLDDNPYNYRHYKGFVVNMRFNLSQLHGYVEIESDTLILNGFNGLTEEEAQMIRDITASGIYL